MDPNCNNRKAFSLTEILLAVGTLAIGMVFIAGVFPVGAILSTRSSEQTIAAVVADEAFAKIRILAADPNVTMSFSSIISRTLDDATTGVLFQDIYAYPSIDDVSTKQYYWSAIGKRIDSDILVTVFISRKVGSGPKYWSYSEPATSASDGLIPRAYPVVVMAPAGQGGTWPQPITVTIIDNSLKNHINEGYTVVDGLTGQIRPVLNRDDLEVTVFAHEIVGRTAGGPTRFWVVPPPVGGGRYPCIGVFQKVMRF